MLWQRGLSLQHLVMGISYQRFCASLTRGSADLLPEVLLNTDTHLDLFADSESEDASDFEELLGLQASG